MQSIGRWAFWRWARFRFRRRLRVERDWQRRFEGEREGREIDAANFHSAIAESQVEIESLRRQLAIAATDTKLLTEIIARERERIAFETANFATAPVLAGAKHERN